MFTVKFLLLFLCITPAYGLNSLIDAHAHKILDLMPASQNSEYLGDVLQVMEKAEASRDQMAALGSLEIALANVPMRDSYSPLVEILIAEIDAEFEKLGYSPAPPQPTVLEHGVSNLKHRTVGMRVNVYRGKTTLAEPGWLASHLEGQNTAKRNAVKRQWNDKAKELGFIEAIVK